MATNTRAKQAAKPSDRIIDDKQLEQWEQQANESAAEALEADAIAPGTILHADPRLRYTIIDRQLPDREVRRLRNKLENLGYREVQAEGVIGYDDAIVYAVPLKTYRTVIRPKRIERLKELNKRFPKRAAVWAEPEYS